MRCIVLSNSFCNENADASFETEEGLVTLTRGSFHVSFVTRDFPLNLRWTCLLDKRPATITTTTTSTPLCYYETLSIAR